MKRSLYSKLTLVAFFLMFAQFGFAQERESRDVSNFDELSISSAFVVEISVGNTESLEIEADERYMEDIITEVRNGRLSIKIRDSRNSRRMRESPRVYLTVKSLEYIGISGAVKLTTFDPLEGDQFKLDISGASVARIEVECEDLRVEASGASEIVMEGSADTQKVRTSGASSYSAYNLDSNYAEIRMSGAGSARVTVEEELDVRLSGASDVRYKGSPKVDSSTSGASSVRKGR
jgi:hypothetical protein